MSKRTFILAHALARKLAVQCVSEAPDGFLVSVSEPTKKRVQEEKYHAMIDDISRQATYAERRWDRDDTKRLLIDEFADEMRSAGTPLSHDGRLVPSENGRRVIQLGIQSRDFKVAEASAFIEFLFAWGADRNVKWSDPFLYHTRAEEPALT